MPSLSTQLILPQTPALNSTYGNRLLRGRAKELTPYIAKTLVCLRISGRTRVPLTYRWMPINRENSVRNFTTNSS